MNGQFGFFFLKKYKNEKKRENYRSDYQFYPYSALPIAIFGILLAFDGFRISEYYIAYDKIHLVTVQGNTVNVRKTKKRFTTKSTENTKKRKGF